MPELPEVEVICQELQIYLLECKVIAVRSSGKPLRQPIPEDSLRTCLCGQSIKMSGFGRKQNKMLAKNQFHYVPLSGCDLNRSTQHIG